MGNFGFNTRNTRMLQIVKGCNLTDASKQTAAFPIEGSVLSGEPMLVDRPSDGKFANKVVYKKITSNAFTTKPVAFAFTDSDSFDVVAAGSILGISALDKFELQTPLFDAAVEYAPGDKLIVKSGGTLYKNNTTGDVIVAADGTISGYSKIAANTANVAYLTKVPAANTITKDTVEDFQVVGIVTEGIVTLKGNVAVAKAAINNPGYWGASINPEGYVSVQTAAADDPRIDNTITGGPALWTEATHTKDVLQFSTTWETVSVTGTMV